MGIDSLGIDSFEADIRAFVASIIGGEVNENDLGYFLRNIHRLKDNDVVVGTYENTQEAGAIFVRYSENPLGVNAWFLPRWRKPE